jgi:arabinosaccharide transport system substrate-binding protein
MKVLIESLGRAPFALCAIAVAAALSLAATHEERKSRPDLVVAVFSPSHLEAYQKALPAFEKAHGVDVELELTDWHALESRLQNAVLSGTEVPDLVELIEGSLGFFTRGPAEDAGFVDLTDLIREDGLDRDFVSSRFSLWSARGRVYALPHDVHPVMLAYRRDLVEQLGIDVAKLDTWDAFVAMGKKLSAERDENGQPRRYALDLPITGGTGLNTLLLQRGVSLFDVQGNVTFDEPRTAATISWYLQQTRGPGRIAFDCGWGQPLMKAMTDGLALFYLAPDWRTRTIQLEVPNLNGKMAVMPLPAWERGGRRTSVWGGSALAISKDTKNLGLAWKLAKHLYTDKPSLGERFLATNILPPVQSAWAAKEFATPVPFFSGQALGREYAALAPHTPAVHSSPVHRLALSKIDDAYAHAAAHFDRHGTTGLDAVIRREISLAAQAVRRASSRVARLANAH